MEGSNIARIARWISRSTAFCMLIALGSGDRLAHAGTNVWTLHGPEGGWVLDAEFHPTDPAILYAAASSGIYKSTDGGATWRATQDDFNNFPADLSINRANPDRLLLATSDAGFLSTNAGAVFNSRLSTPSLASFRVEVSRDGQTAYIAAGAGVHRSTDQGQTWGQRTQIPGAAEGQLITALEIDPADSNVVYAAIFGLGIFRSTDGGASWSSITTGFPDVLQLQNFILDPANPQRILAATQKGLFISDNIGASWSGTPITDQLSDVDVDPANSDIIYVSSFTGDVRKSTDRGLHWTPLPVGGSSFGVPNIVIAPSHSSHLLFIGGDGVSISEDGGTTWRKRNSGLKASAILGFSAGSNRIYAAARDSGIYSIGQGTSALAPVNNEGLRQLGAGRFYLSLLSIPGPIDTLFAVLDQRTVVRSGDGGNTWAPVLDFPSLSPQTIVASAPDAQSLYAIAADGLYKSSDGGTHWFASSTGLPLTADSAIERLAPTSNPAIIYAGMRTRTSSLAYRIYKSSDAGASWSVASAEFNEPLLGLSVHPQNDQLLYAGIGSHLRRSSDGGATWSTVNQNGSPMCCSFVQIVFDQTNPRIMYAVSISAVFRSVDAGAAWEPLGNGTWSQAIQLTSLALDTSQPSTLLLGTVGFGIRSLTVAPDLELTLAPPASLTTNVSAMYTLTLRNLGQYDATNVRVAANLPAGATDISMSTTGATCTSANTTVTCVYDTVRSIASPTLTLRATPTVAGSFAVSASVTGDQPDMASNNNNVGSSLSAGAPSAPPSQGGGGGGALSVELLLLLAATLLLTRRGLVWRLRSQPLPLAR